MTYRILQTGFRFSAKAMRLRRLMKKEFLRVLAQVAFPITAVPISGIALTVMLTHGR
ncbi:MAG: hypothetical protein HYU29_04210 [Chloroflexi bacterium]|nr:hypothetical protein [Chloroflexota bacterium]